MSYDVYFGFPIYPEPWRNYTSNVSPMWTEALGVNLGDLIEACDTAGELLPKLERAVADMKANPDKYREMNPPNGWGNYEGALDYLEWMLKVATEWPQVPVEVSR